MFYYYILLYNLFKYNNLLFILINHYLFLGSSGVHGRPGERGEPGRPGKYNNNIYNTYFELILFKAINLTFL